MGAGRSRLAYSRSLPVPSTELPIYAIWSVRPDGSAAQTLVARQPGEDLLFPAWIPDRHMSFSRPTAVLDPTTGGTPTAEHFSDSQETWTIETVDLAAGRGGLWWPTRSSPT